eukprot:1144939_1
MVAFIIVLLFLVSVNKNNMQEEPVNVAQAPNDDNNPLNPQNKETNKLFQHDAAHGDDDELNEFPSDSDSDPRFGSNRPPPNQSTSCWDGIISVFSSCFSQKFSSIKIEGKQYKIRKLIAEGGFSFVYLAVPANAKQSKHSQFAIKKMIIQTKEQMKAARWEIKVMEQLRNQHKQAQKTYLAGLDRDIEDEKDDLLPNNARAIAQEYKGNQNYIVELIDSTVQPHDSVAAFKIVYMVFPFFPRGNLVSVLQTLYDQQIDFMEEMRILTIFIKICYGVNELHRHDPAWAHRDIKLDNILLGPDDEPYLMDFGSVSEAKVTIRSRKQAVEMQEWAQKNMSGPYTAPEFFNCPSKFKFDQRTDVWALGCLLYAMAFGRSPFDNETGSAALMVLSKVEYPSLHPYSDAFIELIEWMLKVKIKHRPFVLAIIERVYDMMKNTKASMNKNRKKD